MTKQEMEEYVLLKFTEFLKTDHFKSVARQQNALGSKARLYKSRFKKGTLKHNAILAFLNDLDLIEEIKVKDLE